MYFQAIENEPRTYLVFEAVCEPVKSKIGMIVWRDISKEYRFTPASDGLWPASLLSEITQAVTELTEAQRTLDSYKFRVHALEGSKGAHN
jgi:hypothetical protein